MTDSPHIFKPGDLVRAWHYTKASVVDPPTVFGPGEWENFDFKPNAGYKDYCSYIIGHGERLSIVRQVGKPFKNIDHMTERLVASYIVTTWRRNLFLSVWASNHLVHEDQFERYVNGHSYDMNNTTKEPST